ncbi:MAG: hypothetical protein F6J95_002040 [Leptolyngbya sp. SIO1E4]|nr:hypothetical protein [Leptolyngbya sp. SIO1E4]
MLTTVRDGFEPMSLSPGTALQNGHYVIDALLEAAPNGALYWGTHVVTGAQVYIQVLSFTQTDDAADLSAFMTRLQGVSGDPQSPLPSPLQLFLEDDHTLYLAMETTVGLPWSHICGTPHAPMPPKQALETIRQIANDVLWLETQALPGMDLSPNRVWITANRDRLTLTGFSKAQLSNEQAIETAPATVPALAKLLYSFLSGELPPPSDANALKQALQERLPNLSPLIVQAIHSGVSIPSPSTAGTGDGETVQQTQDAQQAQDAVQQWLATLPDAPTSTLGNTQPTQAAIRQPHPPQAQPWRWGVYPALGVTALVAAIGGGTLGAAWRLNAGSLPGAIQFDPDQSFPSQAGWSGDTPEADFESPYVPGGGLRERDRWGVSEWDDVQFEEEPLPETPEWSEEPAWAEEENTSEWETFEEDLQVQPDPEEPAETEREFPMDEGIFDEVTEPEPSPKNPMGTPSEEGKVLSDAEPAPAEVPQWELMPAPVPEATSES